VDATPEAAKVLTNPGGSYPRPPPGGGPLRRSTTTRTETSIVAALRARLTAKHTQIAELNAALRERDHTIAALHGELEKRIAAASS